MVEQRDSKWVPERGPPPWVVHSGEKSANSMGRGSNKRRRRAQGPKDHDAERTETEN